MKRCPQCGYREKKKSLDTSSLRFAKAKRLRGRNARISDRWPEEKARRKYTNERSYVRRDGSERLHGEDWDKRKQELFDRSDGACEMQTVMKREHAEGCWGDMHHPHHIIQRSVRRDDRLANLAGLSRACHKAVDPRKVGGR